MKCFYHNDLDGRAAASVVAAFYRRDIRFCDFHEVDYVQRIPTEICSNNEDIYFVDYSFKDDTKYILDELVEKGCNIIWIDHHTSSFNLEKKYPELRYISGIRKEGISGAALTYMYFTEKEYKDIPYYIKLVSDYDCWKFRHEPDTTHFKLGIESMGFDFHDVVWDRLLEDWADGKQDTLLGIIESGKTIKEYIDKDNLMYRDSYGYEVDYEGVKIFVVNKKSNSWIFGDKYNDYPFVVTYVFDGTLYRYSLYSGYEDWDCSKIAEEYGGGGHRGAAGFTSKERVF